ncbi:uncharacterized protein MONBRDRAFT_33642 [Monosiga brevicollis MX1]|uniref:Uncharacterized protein n=1 Tax=Monosiga brevicollis TaxID=81824 RepID=A9V6R5_MONBE|nr:uncharacterized protein MONBRDRAFT_33642 [Monosiga brevicollis MX1]EDQ86781.1 predicted protein [Monosiga brevicollis MX1]|eukprot:XP_001748326.1 hypothetical protein [Monosiga brevicollis MX1]
MPKDKDKSKRPPLKDREAYERMSFLFQAARSVLTENAPLQVELSRHYVICMRAIARRLVARLDPTLKRQICQQCWVVLVPGITSKQAIRSGKLRIDCLSCGHQRRLPIDNRSHELATTRPAGPGRSGFLDSMPPHPKKKQQQPPPPSSTEPSTS